VTALRSVLKAPETMFLETPGLMATAPAQVNKMNQFGSYIRHKGMTNMTPSRLRRVIRRKAWLRDPSCLTDDQLELKQREKQRQARATHLPNVGVQSQTIGQDFSIFIERKVAMDFRFAPDSYGFSTKVELCSLPIF